MKLRMRSSGRAAPVALAASVALAIGAGGCGSGKSSHSATTAGSSATLTTHATGTARGLTGPRRSKRGLRAGTTARGTRSPATTSTQAGATSPPPTGGAGLTGGKPSVKARVRGLPGGG